MDAALGYWFSGDTGVSIKIIATYNSDASNKQLAHLGMRWLAVAGCAHAGDDNTHIRLLTLPVADT